MASIISLAPELIQQILDNCDPASHLNLALACRGLRDRVDFILQHHQFCHVHYRTTSDIHPSTIPRLLRTIIIKRDWVAAWHFRSIEIWGSRTTWEDWKESYELVGPDEGGQTIPPDPDAGTSYGPGFFTEPELDRFQEFIVKDLGLGVEGVDWLDHIKNGRDDVLKVLLIAACSRLRAVRFIRGSPIDLATLSTLGVAIKSASESGADSSNRHWPPGFSSVQEFAVGVPSRALVGGSNNLPKAYMEHILPLFFLPGLLSLYIYGFRDKTDTQDHDPNEYWGLPIASSPIQNLCFDTPWYPGRDAMKALIQSCRGLGHLTFLNGVMDESTGIYCVDVMGWTGRCLMSSLLWCGTSVSGDDDAMYDLGENNHNYVMTASLDDILMRGVEDSYYGEDDNIEEKFVEYVMERLGGCRVVVNNLDSRNEKCTERLWERALITRCRADCWGECDNGEEDGGGEDGGDDGKLPCGCDQDQHINYPYYPESTPALYLEGVDPWPVPEEVYPWTTLGTAGVPTEKEVAELLAPTRRPYAELIRLCIQWGVGIYTRTTKAPRVHSDDMPTIANEKDIETSPWFKHPDVERLYFKPHKGMVDDCGNCGACRDCYELYPPESWAAWKEEDERLEAEKKARDEEEEEAVDSDDGEDEQDGEQGEDGGDDSHDDEMRDIEE